MHSKRKMYLLRLTALKLWYDVDECYDLVFPLDLQKLSHAVKMKTVQFLGVALEISLP